MILIKRMSLNDFMILAILSESSELVTT